MGSCYSFSSLLFLTYFWFAPFEKQFTTFLTHTASLINHFFSFPCFDDSDRHTNFPRFKSFLRKQKYDWSEQLRKNISRGVKLLQKVLISGSDSSAYLLVIFVLCNQPLFIAVFYFCFHFEQLLSFRNWKSKNFFHLFCCNFKFEKRLWTLSAMMSLTEETETLNLFLLLVTWCDLVPFC